MTVREQSAKVNAPPLRRVFFRVKPPHVSPLQRSCLPHGGAFTLVELLIIVAILAILAAVAIPNFLEAQTRAKVSRVVTDLRTAASALESYRIDFNIYPYDGNGYSLSTPGQDRYEYWCLPSELSTPVAYLASVKMIDPFRASDAPGMHAQTRDLRYICTEATWGLAYDRLQMATGTSVYLADIHEEWGEWRLNSTGPDRTYGPSTPPDAWPGVSGYPLRPIPYDPTNGTLSLGDLLRAQTSIHGYVNVP